MPAGFVIAVSAVVLLHTVPSQTAFCLAGVAIQIVGFVFVAREHLPKRSAKGADARHHTLDTAPVLREFPPKEQE